MTREREVMKQRVVQHCEAGIRNVEEGRNVNLNERETTSGEVSLNGLWKEKSVVKVAVVKVETSTSPVVVA